MKQTDKLKKDSQKSEIMPLESYINKINEQRPVYMPYLTIGDPDSESTVKFALDIIDAGADILELGIPFSDPTADGPVIEAAMVRALASGKFSLESIFNTAREIHSKRPSIPLVFLGYLNPLLHVTHDKNLKGKSLITAVEQLMIQCKSSGIKGLVIPDLPFDQPESELFREIGHTHGVSIVLMVAPNTEESRIKKIGKYGSGFIYYVTSTGVTGERKELPLDIQKRISRVQKLTGLPVIAGFGISSPDHVKLLKKHVQGIIVGSMNHRIIQESGTNSSGRLSEITAQFAAELRKTD